MRDFDQKEIENHYQNLPQILKDALFSADIANKIYKIGEQSGFNIAQIQKAAELAGYLILGIVEPKEFIRSLADRVGINEETARTVAKEINIQIFSPLRESLKSVHVDVNETSQAPDSPPASQWSPQEQSRPAPRNYTPPSPPLARPAQASNPIPPAPVQRPPVTASPPPPPPRPIPSPNPVPAPSYSPPPPQPSPTRTTISSTPPPPQSPPQSSAIPPQSAQTTPPMYQPTPPPNLPIEESSPSINETIDLRRKEIENLMPQSQEASYPPQTPAPSLPPQPPPFVAPQFVPPQPPLRQAPQQFIPQVPPSKIPPIDLRNQAVSAEPQPPPQHPRPHPSIPPRAPGVDPYREPAQ